LDCLGCIHRFGTILDAEVKGYFLKKRR